MPHCRQVWIGIESFYLIEAAAPESHLPKIGPAAVVVHRLLGYSCRKRNWCRILLRPLVGKGNGEKGRCGCSKA